MSFIKGGNEFYNEFLLRLIILNFYDKLINNYIIFFYLIISLIKLRLKL